MPDQTQKLKIQIGDSTFEADGPVDSVQQQLQAFIDLLKERPKEQESPLPSPGSGQETDGNGDDPGEHSINPALLKKVFRDEGGYISLSASPSDASDALLLLLYGFDRVLNEAHVTGVTMMKAARKSGVQVERVDRVIGEKDQYILTGGAKRGKRYSLNNKGVAYVEELIRKLVE